MEWSFKEKSMNLERKKMVIKSLMLKVDLKPLDGYIHGGCSYAMWMIFYSTVY